MNTFWKNRLIQLRKNLRKKKELQKIRQLQKVLDSKITSREDLLENLELSQKLDRLIEKYMTGERAN